MNNLNVNNTRNGSIFLGVVLAVILLSVSGWGACSTYTDYIYTGANKTGPDYSCKMNSEVSWAIGSAERPCVSGEMHGCSVIGTATSSTTIIKSCYYESSANRNRVEFLQCGNQCETDSLQCINAGGIWTNTGASTCDGKSCKMSNCLQSDTLWLNDSKAACDAIGGENNYAITDIDETCVHSGICCSPDSALVGNTCKWRCDSLYTACTAKNGYLYAGVLQDTTISGSDSTFTNKCYYNCSYAYNKDSTTSVTDGNAACSSPSTPIADCTRMPNDFSSVRTTYGDSVYSYDFLTPGSAAYIDSIVLTPCSRFMYRCTVNGKYKYWYSDADIPMGCTNIVKIK